MTCNKRKGVDEKPGVDEMGKKLKMEDDDSELPTLKSQADKFQGADDTAMELLFRDLCRSIQKFAATYFLGKPFIDPRKKEDKAFFESLTSNYSTYLKSQIPDAKETIIQAAIWNKLINVLLKEPIKAFLQVPEALILNHMSDDPEEFYAWRTLTANMLWKKYKGPTSWIKGGPRRQAWVKETATLLLDLSAVNERAKLESRLGDIADHAIKLATAMACNRAYWVCTMKDPRIGQLQDFRIKTDSMEDIDLWDEDEGHGKSLTVDLVAVPMLLRTGNSEGEGFDVCDVMKPAKVVVKAKKSTDKMSGPDGSDWKD